MIGYRHADPRLPFLWEDAAQPPARWHAEGEGPVHYFADTPDGAWAEFLRHEEIREREDLLTVRRAMWVVDLGDAPARAPDLVPAALVGDETTYDACRAEARRLRDLGAERIEAPAAALLPAGARGCTVDGGLREGPDRDGRVVAVFGRRPDLIGWAAAAEGRPREELLSRVRHFHP